MHISQLRKMQTEVREQSTIKEETKEAVDGIEGLEADDGGSGDTAQLCGCRGERETARVHTASLLA